MSKQAKDYEITTQYCESLTDEPTDDELVHVLAFMPEIYKAFIQLIAEDKE